ncbi:MAG: (Fe-S)-binding protein, partial [Deltaproteobacteria bacterium]|nr:(Fe-S)-binding protein [Deltaproteobacteria bacterium]
ELLGIGKNRMQFSTFLPDESEPLLLFLENFCKDIKKIGPSPVKPVIIQKQEKPCSETLKAIVKAHNAFACQDCGKCTSSCPLALSGKQYSPRSIVASIIAGDIDSRHVKKDIWSCLTCGLCYERCPSDVNFPEFIRDIRCSLSGSKDDEKCQAHGGFFQSLMRSMTSPDLKPKRWEKLPKDIKLDPKSKTLFFGGCAPYFDVFFRNYHGAEASNILVDSLRLLNFFDIKPAILNHERCCGHDLLWSGDRENFLKLAELNIEFINSLGIEELITSCPECYKTIALNYKEHGIEPDFKVTHIYEFLENEIDKGAVSFNQLDRCITYQDSCRLNRQSAVDDLPRKLINRLMPESFKEMQDSKNSALCCGNCAWTGCDSYSKALQVKRIRQAHATGSNLLVTSCPKCQIHLRCAMEDPFLGEELSMEMKDLTSIIAETICWD